MGTRGEKLRGVAAVSNSSHIAIYCQDSLGLGHLRRNTLIGQRLLEATTVRDILLITDSPAGPFFQLPDEMDHLKLPSIRKVDAGVWQSTRLQIQTADMLAWRSALLQKALLHYQPDLFLVDHMPAGAQGELLPGHGGVKASSSPLLHRPWATRHPRRQRCHFAQLGTRGSLRRRAPVL